MNAQLPTNAVPKGHSPTFTADTLPAALQKEHSLGPGHWGALHVMEGTVCFVDLPRGVERTVHAPDNVIIAPEEPHRLRLLGPVTCQIHFFREAAENDAEGQDDG